MVMDRDEDVFLVMAVVDPEQSKMVLVQVELVQLALVGGGRSFDRPGNIQAISGQPFEAILAISSKLKTIRGMCTQASCHRGQKLTKP